MMGLLLGSVGGEKATARVRVDDILLTDLMMQMVLWGILDPLYVAHFVRLPTWASRRTPSRGYPFGPNAC